MFVIAGWVLVIVCVVGSFVLMGGHVLALLQPFEFIIIFGAATGAFVAGNPIKLLKAVAKAVPTCFKGGPGYTKEKYLQLIALLYELLQKGRAQGWIAVETDINGPENSAIFSKYPAVMGDHHLREFIIDYLRMMVTGNTDVTGIEDLMDAELTTHHAELSAPANALQRMADAMPAFGIVAAVMGVVHTMGSIGKPASELGEMVAAALVGTFLGILLGYGFIGPLSSLLDAKAAEASKPFECVKAILLASLNGYAPVFAVEFGRKVLFTVDRPSFVELDNAVKATKGGGQAVVTAAPEAADPDPAPASA
jgi:chemotaxis protein MotA